MKNSVRKLILFLGNKIFQNHSWFLWDFISIQYMNTLRLTSSSLAWISLAFWVLVTTPAAVANTLSTYITEPTDELQELTTLENLKNILNALTNNGTRIVYIHKASKELVDEIRGTKRWYAFVFADKYKYQIIVHSDMETVVIIPRGSTLYYSWSRWTNWSDF